MKTGLLEVMEQVTIYFKENLPKYTVLKIRKKSYHPDDSHLYMVAAEKDDGHYGLQSKEDCEKVMDGFYYSRDSG